LVNLDCQMVECFCREILSNVRGQIY